MSNRISRPPLHGLLVQGDKIVGGLDLPEPCEAFVQEFNQRYLRIGLQVQPLAADRMPFVTIDQQTVSS